MSTKNEVGGNKAIFKGVHFRLNQGGKRKKKMRKGAGGTRGKAPGPTAQKGKAEKTNQREETALLKGKRQRSPKRR